MDIVPPTDWPCFEEKPSVSGISGVLFYPAVALSLVAARLLWRRMPMKALLQRADALSRLTHVFDFLPPLFMRLFLAPVFITAGLTKAIHFDFFVSFFGDIGVPFPAVAGCLVVMAEVVGGFSLLVGFALRWFVLPLMFIMVVAAALVHWENGWFTIAPSNPDTNPARWLAPLGVPGAKQSLTNSILVRERLTKAIELLRKHGDYSRLTDRGSFVVLNNGIEFAVTYFIMLLSLYFTGAGRFVSVDYWLRRFWVKPA